MKFECLDGQTRDFELVRDKLIRFGFDPVLLDRDDNQISTSLPPNTGVIEAIKLARDGITLPSYIYHWSKRSKKINPISIPYQSLIGDINWLVFLPSIEVDQETSLHGKLDSSTWLARAVSKIYRSVSGTRDKPAFRAMIFGENIDKFRFNFGYKVLGLHYIEKAREDFLLLGDGDDSVIAVLPSLLGFTNKVMISAN